MAKTNVDHQGDRLDTISDVVCAGIACIGWTITIAFLVKLIWLWL